MLLVLCVPTQLWGWGHGQSLSAGPLILLGFPGPAPPGHASAPGGREPGHQLPGEGAPPPLDTRVFLPLQPLLPGELVRRGLRAPDPGRAHPVELGPPTAVLPRCTWSSRQAAAGTSCGLWPPRRCLAICLPLCSVHTMTPSLSGCLALGSCLCGFSSITVPASPAAPVSNQPLP